MANPKKFPKSKSLKKHSTAKYELRLYIAGKTPNCIAAINNLEKIRRLFSPQDYQLEVIDLLKFPQLAKEDGILAIPTVIRTFPKPRLKAIGDMSNTAAVMAILGLTTDIAMDKT